MSFVDISHFSLVGLRVEKVCVCSYIYDCGGFARSLARSHVLSLLFANVSFNFCRSCHFAPSIFIIALYCFCFLKTDVGSNEIFNFLLTWELAIIYMYHKFFSKSCVRFFLIPFGKVGSDK